MVVGGGWWESAMEARKEKVAQRASPNGGAFAADRKREREGPTVMGGR